MRGALERGAAAAEPAEDREGILRDDLPDEFAPGLDLAVQPLGKLPGVLLGRGADNEVAEAPHDGVALTLQLVPGAARVGVRAVLDPHLPGRVAALELFLLPGLLRGVARPALLVLEPALDGRDLRLDALLGELGLDDPPC